MKFGNTGYTCVLLGSAWLLATPWAEGANIYVDHTLAADCTTGKYSIAGRNCNGSDGKAYRKIQDAVINMATGDTILMRGGVYKEVSISLNSHRHGTPTAKNTIKSYPGEWAVVDGGYAAVITGAPTDRPAVFWGTGGGRMSYWVFEDFEITGGGHPTLIPGSGAGISMESASHCEFRNLYVHDNYNRQQVGASGGIQLFAGGNSYNLFENNYFKCNGNPSGERNTGNAQLAIYADYAYANAMDITYAMSKNEVRFNLFDGSCADPDKYTPIGFMQKGMQRLTGYLHAEAQNPTDLEPNDARYREYGDKIHHNIFINAPMGMRLEQDYVQVYNNIVWIKSRTDSPSIGIQVRDYNGARRGPFWASVYNNTVYSDHRQGITFRLIPDNQYNCINDGRVADFSYAFAVNNIIHTAKNDPANDFSLLSFEGNVNLTLHGCNPGEPLDLNHLQASRNLFFACNDTEVIIRISNKEYTKAGIEATPAADLVWKIASGSLFLDGTGGDFYRTNNSFQLDSTHTLANGGFGTIRSAHPYLAGVTIPNYIGATQSGNDDWVDKVLNLKTMASATPRAPAAPTGVRVR